jgi:hypothetical protein
MDFAYTQWCTFERIAIIPKLTFQYTGKLIAVHLICCVISIILFPHKFKGNRWTPLEKLKVQKIKTTVMRDIRRKVIGQFSDHGPLRNRTLGGTWENNEIAYLRHDIQPPTWKCKQIKGKCNASCKNKLKNGKRTDNSRHCPRRVTAKLNKAVFPETLTVTQLVTEFPATCSQFPPLIPILRSTINPTHILPHYLLTTHFNIILPSMSWFPNFRSLRPPLKSFTIFTPPPAQ